MSPLRFPNGLNVEQFLAQYWQQQALLMPAALDVQNPGISAEELAGLTLEDWVESRLIIDTGNNWTLTPGPLPEELYSDLPDQGWTILVNDVDKHLPEMTRWLSPFNFLPRWRTDDLMISFATAGGSVGPHWDEYDVFLLQVSGHRRWSVAPGPFSDIDLRDDCELKVLADFEATQSWTLGPGDMLYLPPGYGHWGVAEDDCLTFSIGFRAPSALSLLEAAVDKAIDQIDPKLRFQDPGRAVSDRPTSINTAELNELTAIIENAWPKDLQNIVAQQLTQPKPHWPQADSPEPEPGLTHLPTGTIVEAWPYTRWLLWREQEQLQITVNGETYPCPQEAEALMDALAQGQAIQLDEDIQVDTRAMLRALIQNGVLTTDAE